MKTLLAVFKNWQTTLGGIASLCLGLSMIAGPLSDGDPSTSPDWKVALALISAGWVGIVSRDGDKSSKSTGIE